MEIFIQKDYARRTVKVFAAERRAGNNEAFFHCEDGQLVETVVERFEICADNKKIKPLIELPTPLFDDLVVLIVKDAKNRGIQTEDENLVKGKLQATEKHLEDMRAHFTSVLNKLLA